MKEGHLDLMAVASQQAFYFSLESKTLTNPWTSFYPETFTDCRLHPVLSTYTSGFRLAQDTVRPIFKPGASKFQSLTPLKSMPRVRLNTYCYTATSQAA